LIWASPAAWALALLTALPVLAHLWSRKRPLALPFPTLRFLRAATPISRRLGQVHDWPLLLLRLAIVVVICAAASGPTLATRWRQRAWHARLHRVIVVGADGAAAAATAAVNDLRKSASSSTVLGPGELIDILGESIAQADRSASDHLTELAVVWSGSRNVLTASDVADIPARVGIRLVPVAAAAGLPAPAAPDASAADLDIRTDDAALRDALRADIERLRLPPAATPVRLLWSAAPGVHGANAAPASGDAHRQVLRALDEMADDVRLRDAADRSLKAAPDGDASAVAPAKAERGATAKVLARSPAGDVLLRGWAEEGCVVLDLGAAPRSPLTWWSLVSAREALARIDRTAPAQRWSAADVASATREGRVPTDSSLPGGLDTRAAWSLALALLLIEQVWRRRGVAIREHAVSAPEHPPLRKPVDVG
jgi:hypothetical protein